LQRWGKLTVVSPTEYLELERKADGKSEYFPGEMFAVAGATRWHGLIVTNLVRELSRQLKTRPCETYSSDMRLQVSPSGRYTYPDVMVVCGEAQFAGDRKDTLLNPNPIVEVHVGPGSRRTAGCSLSSAI
jgi:Uma2 family endonuclease